jgi:hypothetical protein
MYNTHNGNWGAGAVRALYPSSMGGAFGNPSQPLPNSYAYPALGHGSLRSYPNYTGSGYIARNLGFGTSGLNQQPRRRVTPGGMGTENNWGYSYGSRSMKFGELEDLQRRLNLLKNKIEKDVQQKKLRKSIKKRRKSIKKRRKSTKKRRKSTKKRRKSTKKRRRRR